MRIPSITHAGDGPAYVELISRAYVPYGLTLAERAFGMGAAEQIAYDFLERLVYVISEQGVLHVIDYADAAHPAVDISLALDLQGHTATDVVVCAERGLLVVALSAEVRTHNGSIATPRSERGTIRVYHKARRETLPGHFLDQIIFTDAQLLYELTVGSLPDMILPNHDCSLIAVANEGEGVYTEGEGLVDPEGSVSLIDVSKATSREVRLGGVAGTDDELLRRGVHLPLPLKAMQYYDLFSDKYNRTLELAAARALYTPATQLEPEYLAWSADGSTLYVVLQENSAFVTVDVASATATGIQALGLKDWSADGGTDGLDTVKDGTCLLRHAPGFTSMRMPDTVVAFEVDGVSYLMTANEGAAKSYGEWDEEQKIKSVLTKADFSEWREGERLGPSFSAAAANLSSSMRISLGSTAVDYSDPTAPVLMRAVGFGGRGVSIFRASDLTLVWDSGSALEREGCAAFPWAHNACQDEEFARVGGVLYESALPDLKKEIEEKNDPERDGCADGGDGLPGACPLNETVDARSLKRGAEAEALAVGVACGRMLALTATEKGAIAFAFDVTQPTSPTLLFTFHLSPASRFKNPSVAYADNSLGDIDSETILFLEPERSPTGAAAVMFAGAWSGTVSLYEFRAADGSRCTSARPSSPRPSPLLLADLGKATVAVAAALLLLVVAAIGCQRLRRAARKPMAASDSASVGDGSSTEMGPPSS
mmetsp:Transcript_28245/g.66038  ORF Transcript_28245/g.66038 Transcript_28245/m.66038 type:complete len:711 (-) Transcript_28245:113-2245(-)